MAEADEARRMASSLETVAEMTPGRPAAVGGTTVAAMGAAAGRTGAAACTATGAGGGAAGAGAPIIGNETSNPTASWDAVNGSLGRPRYCA